MCVVCPATVRIFPLALTLYLYDESGIELVRYIFIGIWVAVCYFMGIRNQIGLFVVLRSLTPGEVHLNPEINTINTVGNLLPLIRLHCFHVQYSSGISSPIALIIYSNESGINIECSGWRAINIVFTVVQWNTCIFSNWILYFAESEHTIEWGKFRNRR